ncbi:MAG: glycosyltransferase family 4 protein [Candidatus Micrarchaeota archaeon]
MRIAFFNWRDIRHPAGGGAEVFVHEILRRLAAKGHKATIFCGTYPGAAPYEMIDGIEHVRYGSRFMIYPKSVLCYKKHIEGKYDIIVDSVNGMPFFTPLFAKEKVVPLIYQLTRELWYSGLSLPLAVFGTYTEDLMLRPYHNLKTITISDSTKADLRALGFKDVGIVSCATGIRAPQDPVKESRPTLLYLGRITKAKRVDHAIRAFQLIRSELPDAQLWIAGAGSQEPRLKRLSTDLGLEKSVRFFGRVSEEEKARLMASAHLLLFPAVREGWGIVVLEANACGTPVLGYDVPGVRDSVREGTNGYLVKDGDINAMGKKAVSLLTDPVALKELSRSAKGYASEFSWDRSAKEFESALADAAGQSKSTER